MTSEQHPCQAARRPASRPAARPPDGGRPVTDVCCSVTAWFASNATLTWDKAQELARVERRAQLERYVI
jgi:hypothetical protein